MSSKAARFFATCLLGSAAAVAFPQAPDVTAVVVTHDFDASTVGMANAGDGSGRIFSIAQNGLIEIWNGTEVLAAPFLSIADRISSGGERGLLGLAFHPEFEINGFFYVYYTDTAGDSMISRFSVSANPNVALPGSETPVLSFDQTAANHNAGDMHFGPDGYLYIASGDGGADGCDAQDGSNLLGTILRIDVDGDDFPLDPTANYAIPADNPFVGVGGTADEIWAQGLRNPWRFSFDRETGDIFVGDVGEGRWEEFDRLPAGVGGLNLGWPWFEGEASFSSCANPTGPFASCASPPFTCPILTLGRAARGACSAIGGYRYRGNDFPGLRGIFLYLDWCEGQVHAAIEQGGSWTPFFNVSTQAPFNVTSFGEDEDGELYLVSGSTLLQITGDGFTVFADGFESSDTSRWSSP